MSDIKVVAFESDMKELGDLINKRLDSEKELTTPREFLAALPNMRDYLEGTLTEYQDYTSQILSYLFYNNQAIEKVVLPHAVIVGENAFCGCLHLSEVSGPNLIECDYRAFAGCSLPSVSFPRLQYLYNSAFAGCANLESIDFPMLSSLNSNSSQYAFQDCTALKEVNLPKLQSSSTSMFQGCTSLENITLPCLRDSANYLFQNCTSLKFVRLPVVSRISRCAFQNCSALESLVIGQNEIDQNEEVCYLSSPDVFTGSAIEAGTGYIYVRDNLVADYKAATNWSVYADQIKPLSAYNPEQGGAA